MEKKLSVVVINYNGGKILPKTLGTLRAVDYPIEEIILVDDGSKDDSLAVAKACLPGVRLVRMGYNTGRPNRVRNRGLEEAKTPLVFLMDNDILVDKDCLKTLVEAHERLPMAAICTARMLRADEPDLIDTDGQKIHYVAQTIDPNRGKPVTTAAVFENDGGGGVLLLDRTRVGAAGRFDEDYSFGWGEDGEIYMKISLMGYKCYHVPQAICHHYGKKRTTQRALAQVRNRWFFILEFYSWRTILVISPALLFYELVLFLGLCFKGAPFDYFKGNFEAIRHLPRIFAKRRQVQRSRKVSDRDILTTGEIYVAPTLLTHALYRWGMKLVNGFFNGYWKFSRNLI